MQGTEVPSEPYFVDFLRDAPEPTGDEPEDADLDAPKIYEQVRKHCMYTLYSMFTCIKHIHLYICIHVHRILHINLYY